VRLLRQLRVPAAPSVCLPPPPPPPQPVPEASAAAAPPAWVGLPAVAYVWLTARCLDAAAAAACLRLLAHRPPSTAAAHAQPRAPRAPAGGGDAAAQAAAAAEAAAEVASGACPVLAAGDPRLAFPPRGWQPSPAQVQAYVVPALRRRAAESPSSAFDDAAELAALEAAALEAADAAGNADEDVEAADAAAVSGAVERRGGFSTHRRAFRAARQRTEKPTTSLKNVSIDFCVFVFGNGDI